MKLQTIHLAPYLPHELQIYSAYYDATITMRELGEANIKFPLHGSSKGDFDMLSIGSKDTKPELVPLSDEFIDNTKYSDDIKQELRSCIWDYTNFMMLMQFVYDDLLENHIDVMNLIPEGLARVKLLDEKGRIIAKTLGCHKDIKGEEMAANTERIALTWNSHDELVKQNKELLEALERISRIENGAFSLKSFDIVKFKKEIQDAINNAKS